MREKVACEIVMSSPLEKEIAYLRKNVGAGFGLVASCLGSEGAAKSLTALISKELPDGREQLPDAKGIHLE